MKRIFILAAITAVVSIPSLAGDGAEAGGAFWPWPCCPNVVDPAGLQRPPVLGQVARYRFKDGSEAISQRLVCRDTDVVLWWSWDVYGCPASGCEASAFPASVPWYFPPTLECGGRRMRAVGHDMSEVIDASR